MGVSGIFISVSGLSSGGIGGGGTGGFGGMAAEGACKKFSNPVPGVNGTASRGRIGGGVGATRSTLGSPDCIGLGGWRGGTGGVGVISGVGVIPVKKGFAGDAGLFISGIFITFGGGGGCVDWRSTDGWTEGGGVTGITLGVCGVKGGLGEGG